ncbi:class V aminotransferase [Humibacillus sp. DSM 29435]|uniref:aminotransferase class V-fold PLP-dependent enzyme n=1 Tax=Humibacillus sp. DSM 29435 TaxID=1869167 RepID=UPI00087339B3|nr:aminotransferase class V-fold PLP-dependent enzyme [Humibacillus sp. DSM 29435]OFE18865.1 class V aminotransferase [Humibacillus sp. DSM 29435]
MDLPRDEIDPDGLLEYSVVFTDRSLNHMSARFVGVMQDLLGMLKTTYGAETVAVVPGGGTFAMEAVARQLATDQHCLIVRNGLFSYRWTQILDAGAIAKSATVCQARPIDTGHQSAWAPAPIEEVAAAIRSERPAVVFAPHVETSAGMLLTDDYVRALAEAVHEVGGLLVLDCIASGALWVDMADLGVDVLVSAPQKGWSGSPAAGYVMLGTAAREAVLASRSSSFAADLKVWLGVAEAYLEGKATYHATMPTDALAHNATAMRETLDLGLETARDAQLELGRRVRALLADRGLPSVAAADVAAASVVVVHTDDPAIKSGAAFKQVGLQVAAGVPLQCGEPADYSTVRIGLFGLDKLTDVDAALARFEKGLDQLGS